MNLVEIALAELVKFAAANGADIAQLVNDFGRARPELIRPGDPQSPPPATRDAIDREIEERIERGEI